MTPEQKHTREEIVKEANLIAVLYGRIMIKINQAENEKQSLKGLKKLAQTLETHERQNFHVGRMN
ncbi:MAG TPA: hypothetical protein ENI20_08460 [Bacteroides sp.]|nr:hypothetical protein [Bacteroides sp.]